jgi:NAD-dependent deacetylase
VRPGVVWFGELLPPDAVDAAFDAAARCDVILVIGTSGVVHPAAGLVEAARTAGASVIEINPNESALSGMATARIALPCGQALGAIDRVLCR